MTFSKLAEHIIRCRLPQDSRSSPYRKKRAMLKHQSSPIHAVLHRRGQMSTTAIVFLVLGIAFAMMVVVGAVLTALLLPAVHQARAAARRVQSNNNLKQIGLALHNYHDTYNTFPPGGIYTEKNEPYQSWMTSILPFHEQGRVYSMIDTNQPWTSPTNQPAFQAVIFTFLNPAVEIQHSTVGGMGASHYAANSQLLVKNGMRQIREITDGTSNTILAGDVAAGFKAWGDPDNLRDPAAGFGTNSDQFGNPASQRGIVQMLLADGSVCAISTDINPQTLKALASPDGKESIGEF